MFANLALMTDSLAYLSGWLAQKQKDGNFPVPPDAAPSHIAAVSTTEKFEPDFMRGLYVLEQAMLERELDPDAFHIEKNLVTIPAYRGLPAYIYEYTITFQEGSYNVRRPNDMEFLAYFSTLLLSDEHETDESIAQHERHKSFFEKIVLWLEADAIR